MIDQLRDLVLRHMPNEAWQPTAIADLSFLRGNGSPMPVSIIYKPMLCIALQGMKQIAYGDQLFHYGAGSALVVSIDMPITGKLIGATPEEPYLAVVLQIDPTAVAQMHVDMQGADDPDKPLAMSSAKADDALVDAMLRLARLVERPEEAPILAPLITREILFRVLNGEQGALLRHLALNNSRTAQVARAVAWVRDHFREPLRVDDLAKHVGMSATSLHRHFKALTQMSPLQYQKQLRLQQARQILMAGGSDVGSVSAQVGYESATQFTREYSRMFGAPPRRDTERLRSSA